MKRGEHTLQRLPRANKSVLLHTLQVRSTVVDLVKRHFTSYEACILHGGWVTSQREKLFINPQVGPGKRQDIIP